MLRLWTTHIASSFLTVDLKDLWTERSWSCYISWYISCSNEIQSMTSAPSAGWQMIGLKSIFCVAQHTCYWFECNIVSVIFLIDIHLRLLVSANELNECCGFRRHGNAASRRGRTECGLEKKGADVRVPSRLLKLLSFELRLRFGSIQSVLLYIRQLLLFIP